MNMLPLRTRLDGNQSFESLLAALQTGVLEAFEHPRVTFGWFLTNIGACARAGAGAADPRDFQPRSAAEPDSFFRHRSSHRSKPAERISIRSDHELQHVGGSAPSGLQLQH